MLTGLQQRRDLIFQPMNDPSKDPREIQFEEDLAGRLRLAVEAIHRSKGEIAESIGVSESRFSNWITNQNRPDWFAIYKFCRRYGVSADWILLGELGSLKKDLADSLAKALEEKRAAPEGAARPRRGRPRNSRPE